MSEEQLWEQYSRCVDEYRFQVNLNWSRSQYFFVLNVAILVAGVGLLSATDMPAAVPIVVFIVGAVTAFLSILASKTQHDYYKNIRDLKERIELRLRLGDLVLRTTPGMGGVRGRIAKLTTFQQFILALLLVADVTGLGAAIGHAEQSDPIPRVMVVMQVAAAHRPGPHIVPVVLSREGLIAASVAARPGAVVTVRVEPGSYRVSAFATRTCRRSATVTAAPLQRILVRCS